MTNNRKPVDEVRLSWDAKAAFKSLNAQGKRRQASIDDEQLKTTPYTPPPNVAAWLQAQADKPKPRDYDAILRAAKKPPVGYYEDAPTGIKFGKPPVKPVVRCIPRKPTPPHSAEGPWPKRIMGAAALGILEGPHKGTAYYRSGTVCCISCKGLVDSWLNALQGSYRLASEAEALQWLEQNGHKDVAAQLRGTPRDDVATGGGRVWEDGGFAWVQIGGVLYSRVPAGHFVECVSGRMSYMRPEWEKFGSERDAILSECREAMQCPQKPAQ